MPPTNSGSRRERGLFNDRRGRIHILGDAELVGRIDDVDQVVRHEVADARGGLAVPMSMPR